MNGRLPKKTYKKVVCSLYMEFSEFSLFDLVSGVFSPGWWKLSWTMEDGHQPKWPKMDGQNLLVIFRVNGSIEVANVPGHRHITKGIGQASVVEHLTEQNCWVRVSGSSPLYIFFWAFLPEDLVLANKDAIPPVQSSMAVFQHSWDQALS